VFNCPVFHNVTAPAYTLALVVGRDEEAAMADLFMRYSVAPLLALGLIGSAHAGVIGSVTTVALPGISTASIGPVGVTLAPNAATALPRA
jgi:hypothetical protein